MYLMLAGNDHILIKTNYKTINKYLLNKIKDKLAKYFKDDAIKKIDNDQLKFNLTKYDKANKNKNGLYDLHSKNSGFCNVPIKTVIQINK